MMQRAVEIEGWTEEQAAPTKAERDTLFRSLVKRTWQRCYWTAYDILGDAAEAEDLCQEALVRAYEKWDDFRHQSSPDTWVYRIVVNLCLNHKRRRGIWHRIRQTLQKQSESDASWEGHGSFLSPEQKMRDRQTAEAIHRAMAKLSENQKIVFSLRYLQGFSLPEVAEISGMALGTVKSHVFRALKTMRGQLSAEQMDQFAR